MSIRPWIRALQTLRDTYAIQKMHITTDNIKTMDGIQTSIIRTTPNSTPNLHCFKKQIHLPGLVFDLKPLPNKIKPHFLPPAEKHVFQHTMHKLMTCNEICRPQFSQNKTLRNASAIPLQYLTPRCSHCTHWLLRAETHDFQHKMHTFTTCNQICGPRFSQNKTPRDVSVTNITDWLPIGYWSATDPPPNSLLNAVLTKLIML